MTAAASRSRQPKLLASGAFEGEISSFRLHLAAEGKSPKTIRIYTEAVRWFAAAHKLIPVFTSGELSNLEKACQGRTFAQRRDYAIMAVFRATGIRLSELAGIRYDPDDPQRSDVDLQYREIVVRGKGGQARIVRIGHEAARSIDRYLRVRVRHAQAYRAQLWLGVSNRGP